MHMDINYHVFLHPLPASSHIFEKKCGVTAGYIPCIFQMGKIPHLPNRPLPRKVSKIYRTDGGNFP